MNYQKQSFRPPVFCNHIFFQIPQQKITLMLDAIYQQRIERYRYLVTLRFGP